MYGKEYLEWKERNKSKRDKFHNYLEMIINNYYEYGVPDQFTAGALTALQAARREYTLFTSKQHS